MLRSPLSFAQIVLSVGNPTGVQPAPNAPRGPDYTGRDTSETVFPSHVFVAEDVSTPVRCFRDGSFIPSPARQRLVALTSRRREAARGAAHERASCELHDPMASLSAVDSFFQLAI